MRELKFKERDEAATAVAATADAVSFEFVAATRFPFWGLRMGKADEDRLFPSEERLEVGTAAAEAEVGAVEAADAATDSALADEPRCL